MAHIIAVVNQKGGVGKTTVAFNLSHGLARKGKKVLAVDNDASGNLTTCFLKDPVDPEANVFRWYKEENVVPCKIKKNLHLVGSNSELSEIQDMQFQVIFNFADFLEEIGEKYDFIVIDNVPSFGYLHIASLLVADLALIPTQLTPLANEGLKEVFRSIRNIQSQKRFNPDLKVLGVVINLMDSHKLVMEQGIESGLRRVYGDLVFDARLFKLVRVGESPAAHQSIFDYEPKGKGTEMFRDFTDEVVQRIEMMEKD